MTTYQEPTKGAATPSPMGASSAASAGAAPAQVKAVVTIMVIRALIALAAIIVLFAGKDTLRRDVLKKNPGYNPAHVDQAVNTVVGVGVGIGVVFLVLYLLLALQVSKGRNWARIVTLVLASIGIASQLGSLALTASPVSRIAGVVALLLDVTVIALLASGAARRYFEAT
jgi:hypothetical protein